MGMFNKDDKDIRFIEQLFDYLSAFFKAILEFFFPKETPED